MRCVEIEVKKNRTAKNTAGWGSYGWGLDGGAVGVWLVVESGLNNYQKVRFPAAFCVLAS